MVCSNTTSAADQPIIVNDIPRCPKCQGQLYGITDNDISFIGDLVLRNGELECCCNEGLDGGDVTSAVVVCEDCEWQVKDPAWADIY